MKKDRNGMYDNIRSYHDSEVQEVLKRLMKKDELAEMIGFLFTEKDATSIFGKLKKAKTVRQFQESFALPAMESVIRKSITDLSYSGIDNVEYGKPYLFISNHRDIVLDSALINYLLFQNGRDTTEIAIGNNLLVSDFVSDMMRINKSFIVMRNLPQRESYVQSKLLSSYIFDTITRRQQAVWIAQREGRAKDGDDKTQLSVLKMLLINEDMSYFITLHQLHILPVSISYEFDPCAGMKAADVYAMQNQLEPVTDPAYQLKGMIRGITGCKGRVHLSFGKELEASQLMPDADNPDYIRNIASMLDAQIIGNYRIWPSNLIAYDIITGSDKYSSMYLSEDKSHFLNEVEKQIQAAPAFYPVGEIRKLILEMYARPVINKFGF